MTPEERLVKLGIELPPAPEPLGSYVPARRAGDLLFLSGMLPLVRGELVRRGTVGKDLTVEEAQEEARQAVVNAISVLKAHVGELSSVKNCVKMTGFIASAPDFTEQPAVLNSASHLLFEVFGEAGRHSREAVGVQVLPMNSPVEITFVFELTG